ncbi:MAG: YbaB/EbfC family nucleoid-associated protein [Planctomycetota bacterium]
MLGSMKQMGALAGLLGRKDEITQAMRAVSDKIAQLRVEGQAGGGVCRAWVSGRMALERVEFDPHVLAAAAHTPEGKAQLERLTTEAVNDASAKCQAIVTQMIRDEAARLGIEDLLPKDGSLGGPLSGPLGGLLGS